MMQLFNNVFPAHVLAFTSDRTVDFTLHKDQCTLNEIQRNFLLPQLDSDLPEPVHIRQVHGDKIIIVDEDFPKRGRALEEADGLITKSSHLPLVIRTADCLPVFMYDVKQECIGLIHAGWKGSQKNIVKQAVQLMEAQWQSDSKDIKIAFGPAIRSCCYEVSQEFEARFPQELIPRDGRYYLDLPQVNKNQLVDSGVQGEDILDCGICTCCDKNYFSYRREGGSAGRMISLMMLE